MKGGGSKKKNLTTNESQLKLGERVEKKLRSLKKKKSCVIGSAEPRLPG